MSSYATGWAWQQSPGRTKLLLLALADLADDRHVTTTPVDVLAGMIDKDRSTVFRQLAELEAEGFIERVARKATTGHQLISVTRLLISTARPQVTPAEMPISGPSQNATRQEETENPACFPPSQNATRQSESAKTSKSGPSQNATRPAPVPVKTESQNATHIYKNNSLLDISKINNNNQKALEVVADAGLQDLAEEWAIFTGANAVTLGRQFQTWATWIEGGHTAALRAAAEFVMQTGGYAHPFGGLRARVESAIKASVQSSAAAAARTEGSDDVPPGTQVRLPDGRALTVTYVEYGEVYFEEQDATLNVNEVRRLIAAQQRQTQPRHEVPA